MGVGVGRTAGDFGGLLVLISPPVSGSMMGMALEARLGEIFVVKLGELATGDLFGGAAEVYATGGPPYCSGR